MSFPDDIRHRLVSRRNPHGDITNSDLELAGSFLHMACAADCFDIRERTTLSRTDNTPTLAWQRKGSTTTSRSAAELLRLQARHQRYHRYLKLHDYLPGVLNPMADDASRLQHLSHSQFLAHFNASYPQNPSWHLWIPPRALRSSVISALRNTPPNTASFLREPPPPLATGPFGPTSAPNWPSTLSWKTFPTQSSSYKFSFTDTEQAKSAIVNAPSVAAPLRMPYVALPKRSRRWGPRIHARHPKAAWISDFNANLLTTRSKIRPRTE